MKLRAFSIALLVIAVLGVIGYLSVRASVIAYLRGERFRHNVEAATSRALHAPSVYQPFNYAGTAIYSEGLQAEGTVDSPFSKLKAEQLRADFDLSHVFQNAVEVRELALQRLAIDFSGPRLPAPSQPMNPGAEGESRPQWLKQFLPKTVELKEVRVQELELGWAGGALRGASLTAQPEGANWQLALTGGKLGQTGWPGANLESAQLRYNAPSLFVNSCVLTTNDGGRAVLDGEIAPPHSIDLHAVVTAVPLEPFLSADWRARLHGALNGDVQIKSAWPPENPRFSGTAQLVNGRLEALPILDQIALFTGAQQFRTLELSRASAKFVQEKGALTVTEMILESGGLLRVEGGFKVVDGQIDGTLQVGVTAPSLKWLPGSQERVFNTSRDGYLWTPVRVSGAVEHPREDLTARLAAAAKEKVIEDARGALQNGAGTVIDILKAFGP